MMTNEEILRVALNQSAEDLGSLKEDIDADIDLLKKIEN